AVEPEVEPEVEIEPVAAAPIDAGVADAAPAPPEPVETVMVEVRTNPSGALVEIVGTSDSGKSPAKLAVAKGEVHTARVSLAGYVSQEITMDPAKGRRAVVKLERAPMVIRVRTTPDGAYVYVDGRRVPGETPNEFVLPESFRTKRQLKVGVRKVGYKKL